MDEDLIRDRPRETAAACAVGLALAIAVAFLFQTRPFVDGPMFAYALSRGIRVAGYFLYLPIASALRALARPLGVDLSPTAALQGVNLLAAFLLGAGVYLSARSCAGSRLRTIGVVLLTAATPPVLMYLTAIESHALHAGAAAVALACAARMSDARLTLRIFGFSLALLAVVGTHLTGPLLFPGLLAGAWLRLRQHGVRPTPRLLVPLVLPWIVAGLAALAWGTDGFAHGIHLERFAAWHRRTLLARLPEWRPADLITTLGTAIAAPAALAFPGAVAGFCRALVVTPPGALVALLFVLPYLGVLSVWGFLDEPSYVIALVPVFAILTLSFVRSACRVLPGTPLARAALVLLPFALASASILGLFPGAGIAAAPSAAALGFWTASRERREDFEPREHAGLASALLGLVVVAQAALGIAPIVERNRTNPEAEWVADAAAALPRGAFVLTPAWQESFLLQEVPGIGAQYLDTAALGEPRAVVRAVDEGVRAGRVFAVDDRALDDEGTPRIRALLDALREGFAWTPIERGRFRAHRLLPRDEAAGGPGAHVPR